MKKLKLQAIITAILIYFIILFAIIFAIFYEPKIKKAKNYTEKKSDIIEVSLGSSLPKSTKTTKKKKPKKKPKKAVKKPKKKPKKVRNIRPKKVVKKSAIKKKRAKKSTKVKKVVKKVDANKLFSSVDTSSLTNNSKPKGSAGKSLKKENRSKGEVNRYFAKVQNTLRGWPAQSNFVGEKIKVELTIYPSGLFDYKILSRSLNPEFNRALKSYLDQLKRFGFGPHSNPKPYNIIVEFIAKG